MSRELLVLRHGSAELGIDDLARPLSSEGKRNIQRIGVWMQGEGCLPDVTVASPAERAAVTAQKSLKAGGMGAGDVVIDERVYDAEAHELLGILADFATAPERVLLVGHNPGLQNLVGFLGGARDPLKPGTLVRLAMPDDWSSLSPSCGRILHYVDPSTLPEKFPFPEPGGPELRKRPAYYYTQSGAIPYREVDGALEILIIGSSKRKYWVVPKGIKDPGLTPQLSAAREAHEEAGIEGTVLDEPLGWYIDRKWGAECTCTVYPMQVTTVHDEWEESERGRRWVTPDEAMALLKEPLPRLVQVLVERLSATPGTEESR